MNLTPREELILQTIKKNRPVLVFEVVLILIWVGLIFFHQKPPAVLLLAIAIGALISASYCIYQIYTLNTLLKKFMSNEQDPLRKEANFK